MPAIQGGLDQTYVLLAAVRNNYAITGVSGGGLTWTEQVAQCSEDSDTNANIWTAQGSPGSSFQAEITYDFSDDAQAMKQRSNCTASRTAKMSPSWSDHGLVSSSVT